jgi:hypothetical protein
MNDLILNNVPSREQIERLQMEMSQMPREDLQLAADAMQTEHYFHAGMYARKLTPVRWGHCAEQTRHKTGDVGSD